MTTQQFAQTPVSTSTACPRCGQTGNPVKPVTLESLLKPEALARAGSAAYRFCPSERCDVVYFAESGGSSFTKANLAVRLGLKETAPPRQICYCSNHSVEEIEEQVRLTGKTTVLDDIKTRMKEACWIAGFRTRGRFDCGTRSRSRRPADWEIGDTAGSETCATTRRHDSSR